MAVDFDLVVKTIGTRYQLLLFALLCLPVSFPSTLLVFTNVFLTATPDYVCKANLENESMNWDETWDQSSSMQKCHELVNETWRPCTKGWIFSKELYEATLVTEFELVCDKAWMVSTSTTLFYFGSVIGNVLCCWASDKWGRRTVFFLMLLLEVVLSISCAFPPNFFFYMAVRTIRGFFFPAIFQIPFILCLEMLGKEHRTMTSSLTCTATALVAALLSLMAFLTGHWFKLSLVTSFPLAILLGLYWAVPESPRWLLSQNRIQEAENIVQKMARFNGVSIPPNFLHKLQGSVGDSQQTVFVDSVSPLKLVTHPAIRNKFLILACNWIAISMSYNVFAYYTTYFGINNYLAFFISSIVEVPSFLAMWYLVDKFGRKSSLCTFMLLGGITCIAAASLPQDRVWWRLGLAMVGKLCNAASFSVFYVFVGELMPTVLRGQAMGVGSFIAGLALLTFPFVLSMAEDMKTLPLVVLGCLSGLAGLLATLLPETLGYPLPETLSDASNMHLVSWFQIRKKPTRDRSRRHEVKKEEESVPLRNI